MPKLAGTYEREIQAVVEDLCRGPFATVIDIGYAEGYYAVGLALRIPSAKIIAFDIDSEARRLARAMAEVNGVSSRVNIQERCGPAELIGLAPSGVLVICDAEGFERDLFTVEVVPLLHHCTCLIEFHDFIHPGISRAIVELFRATHTVQTFRSVDDWEKALDYESPVAHGLNLTDRRDLFAEGRPASMVWGLFKPRLG